jgi:hypothetical protein
VDEYLLENIVRDNALPAAIFLPFTIARLRGEDETVREATVSVRLRNLGERGESRRTLRLIWLPESVPSALLPIQEHVATEFAAYGMACVLVPLYAQRRILRAAALGERFDYWIGNGDEVGLEVSGTMIVNLEYLHRSKVRQLLEAPAGVDGYVAVVDFTAREAIFSYHAGAEETR